MRTYGLMYFPWESVRAVSFHHPEMEAFYRGGSVTGWMDMARHHSLQLQLLKAFVVWMFYFGPILSFAVLAWIFTRPKGKLLKSFSPELRFMLLLCGVTYLSCMLTFYIGQPHYVAHLTVVCSRVFALIFRE